MGEEWQIKKAPNINSTEQIGSNKCNASFGCIWHIHYIQRTNFLSKWLATNWMFDLCIRQMGDNFQFGRFPSSTVCSFKSCQFVQIFFVRFLVGCKFWLFAVLIAWSKFCPLIRYLFRRLFPLKTFHVTNTHKWLVQWIGACFCFTVISTVNKKVKNFFSRWFRFFPFVNDTTFFNT